MIFYDDHRFCIAFQFMYNRETDFFGTLFVYVKFGFRACFYPERQIGIGLLLEIVCDSER